MADVWDKLASRIAKYDPADSRRYVSNIDRHVFWTGGQRPRNFEERKAAFDRMDANRARSARFDEIRESAVRVSDLDRLFTDELTACMFDSYEWGVPAWESDISKAEQALRVVFADDYREFLSLHSWLLFEPNYQEFHGHLYGISGDGSLSVISRTVDGRALRDLPDDCYVIDSLTCVPGCDLVVQSRDGRVQVVSDEGLIDAGDSLIEYMRMHVRSVLH